MSRSHRRPYSAITGTGSAADDKRIARRNVRRAQNHALRAHRAAELDWDKFLIPDVYECAYNDVWGWGRDGKQQLYFKPRWQDVLHWFYSHYFTDEQALQYAEEDFEKRKQWFAAIQRK